MTTYNEAAFNEQLVRDLIARQANDIKALDAIIGAATTMSKDALDVVFSADYAMRGVFSAHKSVRELYNAVAHATWAAFLHNYNFYSFVDSRTYSSAVSSIQFSDYSRRNFYSGITQLRPFTKASALEFFEKWIEETKVTRRADVLKLLDNCGKDWRSHPKKFSTKMTVRRLDVYGDNSVEFLRFIRVVCWLADVEFSHDKFFTEWRNNRSNEQFNLVHDLDLTLEKHANSNHTMRMSKQLVDLLNGIVLYNEKGE